MGITVDKNKGGWESLLALAHTRDKENRDDVCGENSERKGWVKGATESHMFHQLSKEKKPRCCFSNY